MRFPPVRIGKVISILVAAFTVALAVAAPPSTKPTAGIRENTPAVHALTGARIVVSPERVIERGTLVIRDGVIVAAGADVQPPADARLWPLDGKTVYPGLIDAFSELPADAANSAADADSGAPYWNPKVTPQTRAGRTYKVDAAVNKKLRAQGITTRLVVPTAGIIKGTSALVTTGDGAGRESIVRERAALHLKLTVDRGRGSRQKYPNSPMGAVALVRQAFYDALWYTKAWRAYRENDHLSRPEKNAALEVLQHYPHDGAAVIIDAPDELYFLRADAVAREFGLLAIVRGSGKEYRRLEAIKRTGRAVILPLHLPKAPNVGTAEAAMGVTLEQLLHWDIAPENAARLDAAGVPIALSSYGLKDTGDFLQQVRKMVARGLSPAAALRALTTTPARLLGVDDRLGTLAAGRAANLIVTDGDLFDKSTKILATWVDGRRYVVTRLPTFDVRGTWQVNVVLPEGGERIVTIRLAGTPAKLTGTLIAGKRETKLTQVASRGARFSAITKGKPLGGEGVVRISGVLSEQPGSEMTWLGTVAWADDTTTSCTARRTKVHEPDKEAASNDDQDGGKDDGKGEAKANGNDNEGNDRANKKQDVDDAADADDKPAKNQPALYPVNFPLGAFGRSGRPRQPPAVLFTNATVWTCSDEGLLRGASVLVKDGKIEAVGKDLAAPAGAVIVDAAGMHITPGVIDCHSHIATDGGINESAQAITAEVRIGDFIDPDDVNIYRQLAGGVTSSNILHGSANPIGGQNQVIKMRWGDLPEQVKFGRAPPGIKFALGENVKQSNWGDNFKTRYPQTRMGVEQITVDAFHAARAYRARHDRWQRTHEGLPPRRDLEQEAIVEILEGKRWIHCHSYRQDEILALLRTLELFDVKIGTFQHILEGYKVASEMSRHGAMGSAFSDWWAYKFEVYDAIPYNGALMHNAGIVVSFNSDDAGLGRRLNTEAAKAIKYGGVSPGEALKFVTLNPARQLRIDRYVGSIEPGKDADLAVWSGSPLSTLSFCRQTWIDGRKYFDREEDLQRRQVERNMRAALIQRILASGAAMLKEGEDDELDRQLWPRHDVFCHHGDHDQ